MNLKKPLLKSIILLFGMMVFLPSYASVLSREYDVELSYRQTALKEVLDEFTVQTGVTFSYETSLGSKILSSVSLNAKDASLETLLNRLFSSTGISWQVSDKVVALYYEEPKPAPSASPAKKTTVGGEVLDAAGIPLIGATVMIEGSTTGTLTDVDGKWTLDVDKPSANLVFDCLGYVTVTLPANGDVAKVVLREDVQALEEVVVVGYGVQKKVNVTGAVSSIDFSKENENRPILSASAALAGMAPGMTVMQGSGQPGSDGASIRIRGVGSFSDNASNPLVLVDGIEWSMDNVNPNDIASISVLKDAASTSIYGTRAANGVILITTKNGMEAKPRISYSYKGIVQMPYNELEWVSDYATYMELYDESLVNIGLSPKYNTEIEKWREAAKDPYALTSAGVPNYVAYPNTNWFEELFQTGYSQEHNLSVSGGSKAVRYMISMGYQDNQGVMNRFNLNSSAQKANFRSNIEADVTNWFTLGTKIYGQFQSVGVTNVTNGFNNLYMTTPGIYPGSPNMWGRPASNQESPNANNVFAAMAGSDGTKHTWRVNGSVYAKIRPYKGVSIEGTFNYAPTFAENSTYSRENGYWNYVTNTRYSSSSLDKAVITNRFYRTYRMSTELLARYDTTIAEEHTLGAIAGYSAISYLEWDWGIQKEGGTDWSLNQLETYTAYKQDSSTSKNGWGLRSYFARVNYSFRDRYLFEANIRVDGSSKFGANNRYGIFPSFSAGWKIHEEPFMAGTRSWLDNLKLRASWGQTGNNIGIGNYAWQATYAAAGVVVDATNSNGLYIASRSNADLKWETTTTTDIGIDAAFFKNKLTAEADYYFKNTTDILFTPSTYLTMGNISQVPSNLGSMWNQGIELSLNWRDGIGKDFSYSVGVNFSYNKNRVTSFKGKLIKGKDENGNYINNINDVSENWSSPGKLCEGHDIGEHYIYELYKGNGFGMQGGVYPDPDAGPADGMIRTESDMEWVQAMMRAGYTFNGVKKPGKDQLWYGDFIYADKNGDKNYGDINDMDFNGKSSTPSYNLGINLGFSYKGLDFSMLWAGAFDYYILWNTNYYNSSNVTWGYGISQKVADDHYYYNPSDKSDPKNNIYGTYPRLYNGDDRNRAVSDFYEYKGDYLKLKNVQLGYTLPEKWTGKFFVNELRFYVSGENLLTITKYPGMDPEMGSKIGYPLMRQVSFGAQVTF